MKRKIFFLGMLALLLTIMTGTAFGQPNDTEYKINGISTKEDIGGVEATYAHPNLTFENYNDFPVTVLFEVVTTARNNPSQYMGTIVLRANEKKVWPTRVYGSISRMVVIVRKLAS